MTYKQALAYLYDLEEFGIKLGLERMKRLLGLLGNPQQGFSTIHIAGTNGKGSTVAFISSILKEAGYKVGSYTSPHLTDFRERITINGTSIPEEKVAQLVTKIKSYITVPVRDSRHSRRLVSNGAEIAAVAELDHPTFFEVVTSLALNYFFEEKVDFVVLEVGLGGRLDATNVVEPLISVITNSDYDHMDKLGYDVTSIAAEHAGIIKKKSLVITAARGEAFKVIKEVCQRHNVRLFQVGKDIRYEFLDSNWDGQCFNVYSVFSATTRRRFAVRKNGAKGIFSEFKNFKIPLLGRYQLINACCAIGVVEALRFYPALLQKRGVHNIVISDESIRKGLEKTRWPGRLELVQRSPLVILDGAHNQPAAKQLREVLREFLLRPPVPDRVTVPDRILGYKKKLILIVGILKDKELKKISRELIPLASRVVATAPKTFRAASPKDIYDVTMRFNPNVTIIEDVKEAVKFALKTAKNDIICVTGSLYTVGEARQFLMEVKSNA